MFNVYAYDQKLKERTERDKEMQKAFKQRQRDLKVREKLNDNYDHRIGQFIVNMIKEPIKIKSYQRPLETAGRVSDPQKFKGQAHIILKGYQSEKQRREESLKNNQFLSSVPLNFFEKWRERDEDKELNERMYFKPRTNLERIKDELMSRHIDITEIGDDYKKKLKQKPKKALRNSMSSHEERKPDPKDEHFGPKEIFASLHKKTYFKSVKSILSSSLTNFNKSSPTLDPKILREIRATLKPSDLKPQELPMLANECLKSCDVQKEANGDYLRSGQGKLVGNPDMSVIETYELLNKISK
ncbi:unnamed protein product [Blepharisma stoltei]|uniref:Uncharacterized protein n=1 Tax=Blepharisma stoltei TaxID=1481888 RepID=A0AAU9K0Q2_9CILI|nr:unnamed protein product [Blepharisma stoltei]